MEKKVEYQFKIRYAETEGRKEKGKWLGWPRGKKVGRFSSDVSSKLLWIRFNFSLKRFEKDNWVTFFLDNRQVGKGGTESRLSI